MHGSLSVVKLRRFDHRSVHKNEIDHRWWSMRLDNPVVKHMCCWISVVKLRRLDHRSFPTKGMFPQGQDMAVSVVKLPRFDYRSVRTKGLFPQGQDMVVSVVKLRRFDHRSFPTKRFARGFENEEQREGSSLNLTSALPLAWPCSIHVSHGVGNDRQWKATSAGRMQ